MRILSQSALTDLISNDSVVPVLFKHILAPIKRQNVLPTHIVSYEETQQIVRPPTHYEVVLALRILEGCCLLHEGSRVVASQYMAIKVTVYCNIILQ
jgi:hypothetical protein